MGEQLSIDEIMHAKDLFTFLSNKEGHGKKGTLIAAVRGTKASEVVAILMKATVSIDMISAQIKSSAGLSAPNAAVTVTSISRL